MALKKFETQKSLVLKFFGPNIFCNLNIFFVAFFLNETYLNIQIFWTQYILVPNFLDPIFLNPNFFGTQNFCWTINLLIRNFGPTLFLDQQFIFDSKFFWPKMSCTNKFLGPTIGFSAEEKSQKDRISTTSKTIWMLTSWHKTLVPALVS